MYNELKDDGFVVLAVNVKESGTLVRNYIEQEGLPFPVLLDHDGSVAGQYGIRSHPNHFLISKNGRVVAGIPGARNWTGKEIRDQIRSFTDQTF